ncbi:MAG TPA: hypothetical protein VFV34_13785, partial [Blastocatellia bacterium]|nr:hypothetical protein [Blastocatellia bacterium]
ARAKNIPVHIFNSRQPGATGTRIADRTVRCTNLIKSIAYKRPVSLVRFGAASQDQLAGRESGVLPAVTPVLSASSGSARVIAVDARAWEAARSGYTGVETVPDRGIITIVGDDMKRDHSSVSIVFEAIRGIDVDLVVHGSSPIAMHLVVGQDVIADVVARLHDVFFERPDPAVFE